MAARLRFTDEQRGRLAAKAKTLGREALTEIAGLVTPDTLLRWYRTLIAKKYDGSRYRGPGRTVWRRRSVTSCSGRRGKIQAGWSYTRIRGALRNLGHEVGRNTVKRLLVDGYVLTIHRRRSSGTGLHLWVRINCPTHVVRISFKMLTVSVAAFPGVKAVSAMPDTTRVML